MKRKKPPQPHKTRKVNLVAKDLRSPKYRQRIVELKTRYKRIKNKKNEETDES